MTQSERLTDILKALADGIMRRSMEGLFRVARAKELSPSHVGALMRIARARGSGILRIGCDMGVTGAAASQMIDRLVQQGLVERREDPEDRRSKRVSLTARGERLIEECRASRESWLAELSARLSAQETELTLGSLRILAAKMKELDEESPEIRGWGD